VTEFVTDEQPGGGKAHEGRATRRSGAVGPVAVLLALGVVFGDIGTSPLYAMRTAFSTNNSAVRITPTDVYGVTSLVLWSITIVVTVKYVTFVLRADNDGEGGVMALLALTREAFPRDGKRIGKIALLLGLAGASLFYGDSVITPAISVLSAVEGLSVAAPSLTSFVVPAAIVILTGLFAVQRWGTGRVGAAFGPLMLVWFACLFAAGAWSLRTDPSTLRVVSPTYALVFIAQRPADAFIAMGAVVLAITGAEALYADVGHVGRRPIRIAWLAVVFPALAVSYVGQAAMLLRDPASRSNPLLLMAPAWARIPGVILATIATVIASQAVIAGTFSITRQAIRLGLVPPLRIRHTSTKDPGQVYLPTVNWALFVAVLALVLIFRSSGRLASAYGVAVTGTFLVDTVLFLLLADRRWHWPRWRTAALGTVFGVTELAFFAANLTKIGRGAWIPLAIALVVFTLMSTWQRGHALLARSRTKQEGELEEFVGELARTPRVPGTAVFPHATTDTTPLALRTAVEFDHVVHERIVIVAVETVNVPRVPPDERCESKPVGKASAGVVALSLRFGYLEHAKLPAALAAAADLGDEGEIDVESCWYVVSGTMPNATHRSGLAHWRKKLYVAMDRNAVSSASYLDLPVDRTIIVTATIDI
jgi:KUP system potassium uptake protein